MYIEEIKDVSPKSPSTVRSQIIVVVCVEAISKTIISSISPHAILRKIAIRTEFLLVPFIAFVEKCNDKGRLDD